MQNFSGMALSASPSSRGRLTAQTTSSRARSKTPPRSRTPPRPIREVGSSYERQRCTSVCALTLVSFSYAIGRLGHRTTNHGELVRQPVRSCRGAFVHAQSVFKYVSHTLGMRRWRSEPVALAHAAATLAAVPTRVSFCPCGRAPQAHNGQDMPALDPISHAVVQQSPSAQQTAASLFRDQGATPRHAQVPSQARNTSRQVGNTLLLVLCG